jgi:protease II
MRPDPFEVVVSHVPFVDVINTHAGRVASAHRRRVRGMGNPKEIAFDYAFLLLQLGAEPAGT